MTEVKMKWSENKTGALTEKSKKSHPSQEVTSHQDTAQTEKSQVQIMSGDKLKKCQR